jgi:signal transduction histidine kinase
MNSSDNQPAARALASAATPQRLKSLATFDIVDTPFETSYDDIVRMASFICQTPIALISFVEESRQWFKAEVGFGGRETPIGSSVCAHAILQPGLFEVGDLAGDARFVANPLVAAEDGVRFYAGVPLVSQEGQAIGTVCVLDKVPRTLNAAQREMLTTLARQTMTQLELRRAVRTAHATNRYRSRLMAVAGHDLKQPLQVISMVLSMLQISTNDPAKLARLNVAAGALQDTVSGLDRLAINSKLGNEDETPRVESFPINMLLDTIEATWREHARHKGLTLKVVPCGLDVESDPIVLSTIVGNLVGNAIKYTAEGGVLIGCRRLAHAVCFHVIDTGKGISEDRQDAIFEAFHQEDANADGLGLGLSIVRRSADALGIKVNIRSVVGKGTNFSFALPRVGVIDT